MERMVGFCLIRLGKGSNNHTTRSKCFSRSAFSFRQHGRITESSLPTRVEVVLLAGLSRKIIRTGRQ